MNANAKNSSLEAISLIQSNKQLFSKSFLGFKPQLAGQLCPTRLTEVRDFNGLWNDNKEKSSKWSEVMGPWICKSAWKRNFPRSQKVKRSVVSSVLQKCQSLTFTFLGFEAQCAKQHGLQSEGVLQRSKPGSLLLDRQVT